MTEPKEMEKTTKKEITEEGGETTREGIRFAPDVDIVETEDAIKMWVDVPGATKDDVEIDVHDGVLTITAAVKPPDEADVVYREYDVGGFGRRFTLGEKIDQSKISAAMDQGVLALTLPKAEPHKPRKIQVT
jgi:HSP20 family protein